MHATLIHSGTRFAAIPVLVESFKRSNNRSESKNRTLSFRYDGQRLNYGDLISHYYMEDDDEIYFQMEQVGGKPIIYLLPPSGVTISANVSLSLVPAWSFSAVYPFTPTKKSLSTGGDGEHIEWDVHVKPGGEMLDKATGTEVACLFWEAQ